jgi:hypothetical protein
MGLALDIQCVAGDRAETPQVFEQRTGRHIEGWQCSATIAIQRLCLSQHCRVVASSGMHCGREWPCAGSMG